MTVHVGCGLPGGCWVDVPLSGGLLELVRVYLEDPGEDDVVDHEEGDDHEGGEDQDVVEVQVVVGLQVHSHVAGETTGASQQRDARLGAGMVEGRSKG